MVVIIIIIMVDILQVVGKLDLLDAQFVLYECDQEGGESGCGSYSVPGWERLPYCGLQGLLPTLNKMRPDNDLGHPLAENLRRGDWMMDYIVNRWLKKSKSYFYIF